VSIGVVYIEVEMATGPYTYPSQKIILVGLPIYACRYKILFIPVPVWVIFPIG
jgi:hypothetical protein